MPKFGLDSTNFLINGSRDVNGPQKCVDFIGLKYEVDQQPWNYNLSEASGDNEPVYCVCRKPFDPRQDSPRYMMFQCEGPCRKWVHPYCFGNSYEEILDYEKKDISYFCYFCRPEDAGKCHTPHFVVVGVDFVVAVLMKIRWQQTHPNDICFVRFFRSREDKKVERAVPGIGMDRMKSRSGKQRQRGR